MIAIDKPRGWMLVPFSWQKTSRNLQAALTSSIAAGDFWARSRNLKFIRSVHRLDADTTGILLLAKSIGAVDSYGNLFESRRMEKVYLAVVRGLPPQNEWVCSKRIGPDTHQRGRMRIDPRNGKDAQTSFRVLHRLDTTTLVEARPLTGRTRFAFTSQTPGCRLWATPSMAAGRATRKWGLDCAQWRFVIAIHSRAGLFRSPRPRDRSSPSSAFRVTSPREDG